jgi:alpha-ribazole phosphatase
LAKLLLVRHGKTKLHKDDRFWGKTDVALSESGIKQAEYLRDRLAREKINAVYTSDMSRTRATAEIIAAKHDLTVHARAELNELNFGWVEGLTFGEICRLHPELAEELSNMDARPHFPGGESLDELNSRLQKFLERLEEHKPKETILIVAHAGTLRILICNLLGIDLECWRKMRIDLGSLSILDTYSGVAIISLLNDVSHLKRK